MTPLPPVLIISDAVSSSTGLGRIARQVAIHENKHLKDACRVATLGYGGPGSQKFNFPQYHIEGMGGDFVIRNLPEVWEDWAGKEPGVILCIWDASRLGWLSRPAHMCEEPLLKQFFASTNIQRWIYAPVDAEGPHGKLAMPLVQSLLGFDRILAYGRWAENIIQDSLGEQAARERDLWSVPHGIDSEVFYERNRTECRNKFSSLTQATSLRGQTPKAVLDDEVLVGTIATNQARKDWGLWAACCKEFLSRHPKTLFWVHVDRLEKDWSIPQLLVDFGLLDKAVISLGYLSDDQMAQAYSACDLTLGIGAGEGFGIPIFESLFCGTPCIHGYYGGAPEHLWDKFLVNPIAYRYEGLYCSKRPVYNPEDWADKMDSLLGNRANRPSYLDWTNIWPRFEAWFRKGLANA